MHRVTRLLLRAAIASVVLCNLANVPAAVAQANPRPTSLEQLTQSLIALSESADQSSALEIARQRRDVFLSTAASSPREALQHALPSDVAKKLPASVAPYLETEADETGTLQAVVEDYAHEHRLRFFLDTGRETLEVYFASDVPPSLPSGSRIRGRGKRLDKFLLLPIGPTAALSSSPSPDTTAGVTVLSLSTPDTFGAQSTAVLLVNFFDAAVTPFTLADVRNIVFTDVSNYDLENSQNQTWLTGDVFGWITLPTVSVTQCPNLPNFTAAAQQAASDAGLNLASYKRFVYIFPQNGCSWLGQATISGVPSHAMINGNDLLRVIGHEMGHNFGLFHSHSYDCGGVTLGSNCQLVQYGDIFDIMGQFTGSHFNAFQKERLGWLNYGTSLPITTVTSGGAYTVTPYETGAGVKALKVLRSTDVASGRRTWYYIEYRQLIGFDIDLTPYPTSTTGVLIHSGAEGDGDSSLLLNMNPQSGFENAALGVGQSFVDTTAGVSITTRSANAAGATVDVEFGPGGCHSDLPLITVTPTQAPPASAGSTQSFLVFVTNQDSAGCAPTTVLVSTTAPSSPAGWSATLGASSFKLAPLASTSTVLQVTSPATAPAGSYPVGVTAMKWPVFTSVASTTATYVVSSIPLPDFAITAPASASVQQGGTSAVSVASTLSNGFSAPLSFAASGLPAGVTATFSPASLPAPGSGVSTLTFNAAAAAVAGSYSVTIAASGGGVTHLAALALAVTSAPPPPPPPPPQNSFTLFSSNAVPAVLNVNAGSPLEMGMKFLADRDGLISGVRFYKGSNNLGTHTGSLWTSAGKLLAQGTFTNETASGWQQVTFSNPVTIAANAVYVVSYHSSGFYSYTTGYFNSPVDNPPLHAIINSGSANGVYSYGANAVFPATGAAGANFWVDVIFTPSTSTASLTSIAITPANPSIAAGSTQQFHATGTYSDATARDITSQVSWSSATPAVAGIDASGVATAIAAGSSLITATSGSITGSTILTVTAAPPPPQPGNSYSLFDSSVVPAVVNASAGSPLELGMKFTADRDGQITGIRFFKGPSNLGTHVGSLWTAAGQLLAQASFTNETASGWQQVNFSSPVAIAANTVYVVSYHSSGYYSYDVGYFNSPVSNPPLTGVAGAGVYSYAAGSIFPKNTAAGANFWVDVVFTTSTASLLSIAVTPAAPSIGVGAAQQFHATAAYSDSTTRDITTQVRWSSATPLVATITATGVATGLAAGTSLISAAAAGVIGSTQLSVTGAPPPPPANTYTLFSPSLAPAVANANGVSPLELGMKFTADRDGEVTSVRFYKGSSNTGTHVASLWTSTGQLLAQAAFTGETASGWQQVDFSSAVPITANTVYVVSYHSAAYYSYTLGFFNSPVNNSPLHAVAASSGNGVYRYGGVGTFPTTAAAGANFWVDVVFR